MNLDVGGAKLHDPKNCNNSTCLHSFYCSVVQGAICEKNKQKWRRLPCVTGRIQTHNLWYMRQTKGLWRSFLLLARFLMCRHTTGGPPLRMHNKTKDLRINLTLQMSARPTLVRPMAVLDFSRWPVSPRLHLRGVWRNTYLTATFTLRTNTWPTVSTSRDSLNVHKHELKTGIFRRTFTWELSGEECKWPSWCHCCPAQWTDAQRGQLEVSLLQQRPPQPPRKHSSEGLVSYVFNVCTTPDKCNVKGALCAGGSGGWLWLLVITD